MHYDTAAILHLKKGQGMQLRPRTSASRLLYVLLCLAALSVALLLVGAALAG